MLLQMAFRSFLWLGSIPLCLYGGCGCTHICSFVNGHGGCFHVSVIINGTLVDIAVCVSFQIMFSFGYMPRSGVAGSYVSSVCNFLRIKYFIFDDVINGIIHFQIVLVYYMEAQHIFVYFLLIQVC